jgi:diacylglycerol kinase family enzyme
MRIPGGETFQDDVIVAAVCNGKQAGGGQQLAPGALIDDGLLDIVGLVNFLTEAVGQVIKELSGPETSGDYVKRLRMPWAEWESDVEMPLNLDGEPIKAKKIRFEVLPGAIKLVVPENCPLTASCS